MNCKCPKCGNQFEVTAPMIHLERTPDAPENIITARISYPGHVVTEIVNYTKATVNESTQEVPGYGKIVAFNEDGSTRGPLFPQGEFFTPAAQSAAEEQDKQDKRRAEINALQAGRR